MKTQTLFISVITELSKTLHKLSKIIREAKKVGSNNSLYKDIKESRNFLNEKITNREHAFKAYASAYNVEILNSFNPELQLKNTESAIKTKLIDLLTQLKANTVSLSRHEQVCLSGLRFERYFSHHRAM